MVGMFLVWSLYKVYVISSDHLWTSFDMRFDIKMLNPFKYRNDLFIKVFNRLNVIWTRKLASGVLNASFQPEYNY